MATAALAYAFRWPLFLVYQIEALWWFLPLFATKVPVQYAFDEVVLMVRAPPCKAEVAGSRLDDPTLFDSAQCGTDTAVIRTRTQTFGFARVRVRVRSEIFVSQNGLRCGHPAFTYLTTNTDTEYSILSCPCPCPFSRTRVFLRTRVRVCV